MGLGLIGRYSSTNSWRKTNNDKGFFLIKYPLPIQFLYQPRTNKLLKDLKYTNHVCLSSYKELARKEGKKKLVVFQIEAAMAMNLMKMWMIMVVVLLMMVADVKCDAKEREQCSGQLIGLATCLPYVGGTAKQPTADCCKNMEQVLAKSKKCVCLLVRNRNDPSLGYKVNVSLAANLPTICKTDATISDCPKLLGLPANSPDAQVFNQLDKQLHQTPSSSAENGSGGSEVVKTDKGKADRSMDLKMAAQISFWCFASLLIVGV